MTLDDGARPSVDGQAWLTAAMTGGLPEPTLERWQPLRVGIVNLWEYDNAEFWFADGRLVLRGGNGAGKTKVLELTTLMLLRGEIGPSVLDPFGSQHRTMRFNLLPTGDGDDPREPTDAGLGYAWAEFGRRDAHGGAQYLVCGMGASARRGTGTEQPKPWHLITQLRPGKDFALATAARPLDRLGLKKIEGVHVPDSATEYRSRLASELFGLAPDAYDNLTELLKQLRKPKLGERLNPTSLAETLRDALPPLAASEVTQLAEGWDHLEQLRQAVEQTEHAATAVARFVRNGWQPWARASVRRRADALAATTTTLDNTTRAKRSAQSELDQATSVVEETATGLETARRDRTDAQTALRELLDSSAYQDAVSRAGRVESLRHEIGSLTGQLEAAKGRLELAATTVRKAEDRLVAAGEETRKADERVERHVASLREHGAPAGLASSVERHLPGRDVDALLADHAGREERFGRLRELQDHHARAEAVADRSAATLSAREAALADAREQEDAASTAVEAAAETLVAQIRDWAASVTVARCPGDLLESWCDMVPELTVLDTRTGAVEDAPSVSEAIHDHLRTARDELANRREEIRLRRQPVRDRQSSVELELAEVREVVDAPPAAPALWRRRARPEPAEGCGAPLWRCVQPRTGTDDDTLALIEAALAASGLLDAWLSPDGRVTAVSGQDLADVHFPATGEAIPAVAAPAASDARTLASVLEPTPAGAVPAEVVSGALTSVGWHEGRPADDPTGDGDPGGAWLAADGSWRLGRLTGRAEPVAPVSYLGATAREAARQREIARLEAELTELVERLRALDDELESVDASIAALDTEARSVPKDGPVTRAAVTLGERGRRRAACEDAADRARAEHDEDVRKRDEAWGSFAGYAAEHAFPLRDLDAVARALRDYRQVLGGLGSSLERLAEREEDRRTEEARLAECREQARTAEEEVTRLDDGVRRAQVRLRTAQEAMSGDHADQLRRREDLDAAVQESDARERRLGDRLTDATRTRATAESVLDRHEEDRARAEVQRDAALAELWAATDAGLVAPLGLTEPERRTVEHANQLARTARREIAAIADGDEDRALRRCYSAIESLRNELLPNRDAKVAEDDPVTAQADGQPAIPPVPRMLVLADPSEGWQPPSRAADALADRVREQREGYDAEQQRVLTTLLGSTFIEHLKDRLDYTAHTFARINDRLAKHPTRHGHAVRLQWEASPADPDAGAVVTALGQGYAELGPERQEMVRNFLARKIDEARADAAVKGTADWKEQLATALDYRRWLRIVLQYRPGGGSAWSPFDSAKHGAKSGGEKVVLLSQPLFAAAVVAYDAAADHAPRWVWLDEAMTGVDAGVKASFMGLTVEFNLDVMLTAHDEWCTYTTVPAVAVYDLAREEHLPGVDVMPYLWCGGDLTQLDVDRLGVAEAADPLAAEGLFAPTPDGDAVPDGNAVSGDDADG